MVFLAGKAGSVLDFGQTGEIVELGLLTGGVQISHIKDWPPIAFYWLLQDKWFSSTKTKGGECMQAYCVKCRAKKEMKDAKSITMKNGKPATQGVCPTCGTKMFRIGKS